MDTIRFARNSAFSVSSKQIFVGFIASGHHGHHEIFDYAYEFCLMMQLNNTGRWKMMKNV